MSNENEVNEFLIQMKNNYQILKNKADKAIVQITTDHELNWQPDPDSNSVGIILRHIAGNMKSRWSEFLTTDGEKESRKRDDEFDENIILPKEDVLKLWNEGWNITLMTIDSLTPDDMLKIVKIRGIEHTVIQALYRQLIHYAEHIGQLYYLCKLLTKDNWQTLSLPKRKI